MSNPIKFLRLPRKVWKGWQVIFSAVWQPFVEFHMLAPFKIHYGALIAVAAFPCYYFIWTYIFPQPYENLPLRLFNSALCLAVAARPLWPAALRPYFLPYVYGVALFCLPAFFTFMLLMNGANAVWLMSAMVAFLFVILLYDILNAVIVSVLGSLLGIGAYYAVAGIQPLPEAYLMSLPIYPFSVVAMAFLTYSERSIIKEKLMAAKVLASNIAHEMRTPLLGIRFDCEQIEEDLPKLLAGDRPAPGGSSISKEDYERCLQGTKSALRRINEHALSANLVIDMLLVNLAHDRILNEAFAEHRISGVIHTALERYHFRRGERDRVTVVLKNDFLFWGSDILMVHVIFNLLKNALHSLEVKGAGTVTITAYRGRTRNILSVRDTGPGIPPEIAPVIFTPFVTGGRRLQGSGIGLSFCKRVVESLDGSIGFHSYGTEGAEFVIALPFVTRPAEA